MQSSDRSTNPVDKNDWAVAVDAFERNIEEEFNILVKYDWAAAVDAFERSLEGESDSLPDGGLHSENPACMRQTPHTPLELTAMPVLLSLEEQWKIEPLFIMNQVENDPAVRTRHIQWLIGLRKDLQFSRYTLFRAVSLADHYLQKRVVSRREMELLWPAALCVAAGHEETAKHHLCRSHIISLRNRQDTTRRELMIIEEDIEREVGTSLRSPLSLHFVRRICEITEASDEDELLAMQVLEACLAEYQLSWVKPSKLAAAAMLCSLDYQEKNSMRWEQKLRQCCGHPWPTVWCLAVHMTGFMANYFKSAN